MKNLILIGIGAISASFFIHFFNKKGEISMVDLYVGLVDKQKRTCNPENKKVRQVPDKWKPFVMEDLDALGLDADGYPVVAE